MLFPTATGIICSSKRFSIQQLSPKISLIQLSSPFLPFQFYSFGSAFYLRTPWCGYFSEKIADVVAYVTNRTAAFLE